MSSRVRSVSAMPMSSEVEICSLDRPERRSSRPITATLPRSRRERLRRTTEYLVVTAGPAAEDRVADAVVAAEVGER
jgi:hypothetical protein